MKKYITLLLVLPLLIACTRLPHASFTYKVEGDRVSFYNNSDEASSFYWDFGDGTFSSLANPIHTYNTSGTYRVELIASNSRGDDLAIASVRIEPPEVVTFITVVNPLPVEMDVYFNDDVDPFIVDAYNSAEFELVGTNTTIYTESYGFSIDGNGEVWKVGEVITWEDDFNLTGEDFDVTYTVGEDFYFIFMTNNISYELGPLYINCGNPADPINTWMYLEDIFIPNDNTEYNIGWYVTTDPQLNVVGKWDGTVSDYSIWQNMDFFWDNNNYLYVELYNDPIKSTKNSAQRLKIASSDNINNSASPKRYAVEHERKKNAITIPDGAIKLTPKGIVDKPRNINR